MMRSGQLPKKRIVILSAYGYDWELPEDTTTSRGFLRALEDHSLRRGREVEVEIHHTARREDHRAFLRRRLAQPVDLIYAGSASLMEVAREMLVEAGRRDVALVYWGSHIVDWGAGPSSRRGFLINPPPEDDFVAGLQLEMPLYIHHRQFRVLKELFPRLERIYCPFSVESAFYHRRMAEGHRRAVERHGPACWVEASGEYGGFPGLGNLAEIIGATFYEHPCSSAEILVQAVEALPMGEVEGDQTTAILLNGIECFHIPGANEALVAAADRRGLPYVGLNFGSFHSDRGPLAIFTNDIEHAAYGVGELAVQVLSGTPPSQLGVARRDCFRFAYNEPNGARRNHRLSTTARRRIGKCFAPFEPYRGSGNAATHGHHREPLRLDSKTPGGAGGSEGGHLRGVWGQQRARRQAAEHAGG
jgi:hypothetical protein